MAGAGQPECRYPVGVTVPSRVDPQWATTLQQPGLPESCFLPEALFLLGALFSLNGRYFTAPCPRKGWL